MRIFVDADACPVVKQTEKIARRFGVPVGVFQNRPNKVDTIAMLKLYIINKK